MERWIDIEPERLLELIESGEAEASQIIDVREPQEWEYYRLETSTLIPMNAIPYSLGRLPDGKPLYIVCAHGVRSAAVCGYLEEQGYADVYNVAGGMAAVALLRGFQYD